MKNYEITEEQIKELAKGNAKVKKMFPEVFENKLEIGRWYKIETNWEYLIFIEEIKNNFEIRGYGFNYDYTFNSSCCWCNIKNIKSYTPATNTEVEEALTNEAKKKGFNKNNYRCLLLPTCTHKLKMNYKFDKEENSLRVVDKGYENVIFYNGKWATIIPTYTKEEAEKLLNAKII